MNKSKLFFLFVVCALTLCSCSPRQETPSQANAPLPTPGEKKITSVGVVKADPQKAQIIAGESGEAVVHLSIQKGFHVNANPPTYPYLIATELKIPATDGVSVGKVIYPKPVNGKFPFAEKPLEVYEGDVELKAELKADKTVAKGDRALKASLRIQACDDQVCYPPGTVDLQIPVTIK